MSLTHAERLLQELGIADPQDIDLEAIAFHMNARVKFRPLSGCEARIIGRDDEAIITVNINSTPRRQRFSIAHELGHWHHHRGQCLACRLDDYQPRHAFSAERVADGYAADLMMPNYLFRALARQQPKLTFKIVAMLADRFDASKSAVAIRLVEMDHSPSLLVCHGPGGRKWFTRAVSVPDKWFPQEALHADSFAFGVQFGGQADDTSPRRIGADAWFDRHEAERFEVHEQTIRTGPNETLTLLLLNDPKMIEERESGSRSTSYGTRNATWR